MQSTIRNPTLFLSNHSLCIKNICEKGKNAFDKSKIYLNRFSQIRKIELQYNCNWMIKKRIAKELQFTMLIRIFLILILAVIAMKGKFE